MGTTGGNGDGALMGGDTWVIVGGMGAGLRGTNGRRHIGTTGGMGAGYRGTNGRRHMDTSGGVGAVLQGH